MKSIRSESKRILLGCRSTEDCPFRIKARCSAGRWRITVLRNEHTCIGAPAATRSSASHLDFLRREIPKLMIVRKDSTGQQIVDVIKSHHGHEISLRQAQKVLLELKNSTPAQQKKIKEQGVVVPKRSISKSARCGRCNGPGHNRRTCTVGGENMYAMWQPMEGNTNIPIQLPE